MAQQVSFILRDVQTGHEYPISSGGLRIGRMSQNDVTLDNEKVSRNHATLWVQKGQLLVRDEDSTNGTWVNEKRITASQSLQRGDRVRVGDTTFEVAMTAASAVPLAERSAVSEQQSNLPVVPFAIGGGVVVMILFALMFRGGGQEADVLPTQTPTSMPTSTVPATPTSTPTKMPTYPPTQELATRVPATAVPQAQPPELRAPSEGSENKNPVVFKWSGTLKVGQTYQVNAYHPTSGHTLQSGLLTAPEWRVDLPAEKYGGWHWTVSVMEGTQAVATSPEWMFWFQPFPGADDDGGGGGNGGDGGNGNKDTPASPTNTPEFRP
jgi:pSer/pThr/pTyr-binding forkhead associated (FHA) protein